MGFAITTPAQKRYLVRSLWCSALCLAFTYSGKLVLRLYHPSLPLTWLIAAVAALPILGALAATAAYLREEKDEFQLTIFVQALLAGIVFTLAVTTVWGFLEDFASAPHLDPIWIYALFWIFAVLCIPFLGARYLKPSQNQSGHNG